MPNQVQIISEGTPFDNDGSSCCCVKNNLSSPHPALSATRPTAHQHLYEPYRTSPSIFRMCSALGAKARRHDARRPKQSRMPSQLPLVSVAVSIVLPPA